MADTRGCPHHGRSARLKLRGRGLSARKAVFVPRCASHLRGHAVWSEPVPASAVASLRALELGNRPGPIGGTGANGARRTRREAAVGAAPPPGRKQPGGVGGTQQRVGRVTGLFHPRGWQTGRRLDSHSSHVRVRMAPRKGRRGGSPQNERRGGGWRWPHAAAGPALWVGSVLSGRVSAALAPHRGADRPRPSEQLP